MSNQTQNTSNDSGQGSDQNTDTSNESGGKYAQISKYEIIIAVTIGFVLIIISILVCNSNKLNELSDLGDYLAGTFAVLAWLWLIFTAHLQYEELKLQREELKLQRKELEKSADAQQGTEKALREQLEITRQQFELYLKELKDRKPNFQIGCIEPKKSDKDDGQYSEIKVYLYNKGGEVKQYDINWELGDVLDFNIYYAIKAGDRHVEITVNKNRDSFKLSELHRKKVLLYTTIPNGTRHDLIYHFVVNDDNIELKEWKFETNSEQNTNN